MFPLSPLPSSTALPLWNNFTADQPVSPPFSFNPSLFQFYRNHFHWKPYYFLLFEDNKVVGLLPLVNTGKTWVSLPHFSYGGFLVNDKIKINFQKLILRLINIIEEQQISSGFVFYQLENDLEEICGNKKIYIRTLIPVGSNDYKKVTSLIHLSERNNDLFQQLSSNLRRKIRKAENNDFVVKTGKKDLLDDFYSVYTKNMQRLGSPPYGKKFFNDLLRYYDFGEISFFVVYKKNSPVGVALIMSYNGFWENAWFSTNKEMQKMYISDFLHWQMIQYAIEHHAKVYSFGRSTKEGTVYRYKNHWPVVNQPLYEYSQNRTVDIKNHKWLAGLWRNIPYPVAYCLGPVLIKHIY